MRHSDLNAMGVEEMNVNEEIMVNGGLTYVIDGLAVSKGAFRAWAKANDVDLTGDTWIIWP